MEEIYSKEGVEAIGQSLGRPIPGQSLTNSPDTPYPWEGPAEHTNLKEALNETVRLLLERENMVPILMAINDGVPIIDIAQQILYVGFREGKWNPDLMLMLAEPVAYVLMFMAENADIKYRIDSDDDDAGAEDEDEKMMRHESLQNENMKKVVEKLDKLPKNSIVLGPEVSAMIEEKVSPSLLEREEQEMEPNLLGRSE